MRETVAIILIGIGILGGVVAITMLIRNELVYKYRIFMLDKDRDTFLNLPSYNAMLHNYKVWDFKKHYGGKK